MKRNLLLLPVIFVLSAGCQKNESTTNPAPELQSPRATATEESVSEKGKSGLVEELATAKFLGRQADVRAQLEGKIVGLYFTASWCGPCKAFSPELVRFRDENSDDFAFVVVSLDTELEDQSKYAEVSNLNALEIRLDDPLTTTLIERYDAHGIPRLVVFSSTGDLILKNACSEIRCTLETTPAQPTDRWTNLLNNWQSKRLAELRHENEVFSKKLELIFEKHGDFELAAVVEEQLGNDAELRTSVEAFLASPGNDWQDNIQRLAALATDLDAHFIKQKGTISPLHLAAFSGFDALGKELMTPDFVELMASWKESPNTVKKRWALRAIATSAVSGNSQASKTITSMNTGNAGDVVDVFEALRLHCGNGNQTALELVSTLYEKNHYFDYMVIDVVRPLINQGNADALELLKRVAATGEHDNHRESARRMLQQKERKSH